MTVGAQAPMESLTQVDGKLYGITRYTGLYNGGIIFEWDPATNTFLKKVDLIRNFPAHNGLHGKFLTYFNGKLYGVNGLDGINNEGVIFEWDPTTNIYTKKIDFSVSSGSEALGALILLNDKFYGMTNKGGTDNAGVIFEWDPATNIYTKKFDFIANTYIGTGETNMFGDPIYQAVPDPNGNLPIGSLSLVGNKFYGMTPSGGANNKGVIFEWDPATNIYTKKFDFDDNSGYYYTSDSQEALVFYGNKFYGVTPHGGINSQGVIFEWDPTTNIYTKKIDFDNTEGKEAYGSLVLLNNKFYGMNSSGGASGRGVIFQYDAETNIYTKKVDLSSDKGYYPKGSPTLYNGKLYGTIAAGGVSGGGTLFEYDPNSFPTTTSSVSGISNISQLLTGSYTYTDADNDLEGTSTFRWLRDDVEITGETSQTYTTVLADVGHTIKFEVTPVALTGTTPGIAVASIGLLILNSMPTTSTPVISGSTYEGNTLTGSYTYSDLESDLEGTSTFRWLRDGIAILSATSLTYTTTSDDVGKTITFEVTPIAATGELTGTLVVSDGIVIENRPSSGSSGSIPTSITPTVTPSVINCLPGYLFDTNTGLPCTVVTPVVLCPAGDIFSTETGARCTAFTNSQTKTPNITRTLKITTPRMTGLDIKELQTYLNNHNYNCGLVDGVYGIGTKAAVIQFQLANGLKGDGAVGSLTRGKIK